MSDRDFDHLPVSSRTKAQIRQMLRSTTLGSPALRDRSKLLGELLARSCNLMAGTYLPVSWDIYLKGKLPDLYKGLPMTVEELFALRERPAFFTNILVIPVGYWTADFDSEKTLRSANHGRGFAPISLSWILRCCLQQAVLNRAFSGRLFEGCNINRFGPSFWCALGAVFT